MFCDRTLDSKINRIHEKALRIVSQNKASDFKTLLVEANSMSIQQRDLQLLMIEVYKTKSQHKFYEGNICTQGHNLKP